MPCTHRGRAELFAGIVGACGVLSSHALAQPSCDASWLNRSLLARASHAATYDPDRGMVVVFGGASTGAPFDDVCLWDGSEWTCRPAAPQVWGRKFAGVAYDRARHELVLFGGEGAPNNVTWTWDATSWTMHDVSGPELRSGHAMAYDEVHQQVVLYAGRSRVNSQDVYYSDTWTWDGSSWTLRSLDSAPGPRAAHSMIYDPRGRVTLFGGRSSDLTPLNDVWTWTGTQWQQLPTSRDPSPPGRWGSTLAFDPAGNRLIVAGGSRGDLNPLSDAWALNGLTWTAIQSLPARIEYATLVCNEADSRPTLIGGAAWTGDTVVPTDSIYTLEDDGWVRHPRTSPPAHAGAALAFDEDAGQVVLFGGGQFIAAPRPETWVREQGAWRLVSSAGPSAREGAAMCWFGASGRVVLFGGRASGLQTPSDTWEWDGAAWSQRAVGGPPGRWNGALVADPARSRLLLYAGQSGTGAPLDDLWSWDGARWIEMHQPGPRPPSGSGLAAYDTRRDRLVVFGGWNSTGTLARMWDWNGQYWSVLEAPGPVRASAFGSTAFWFDRRLQRAVLVQPQDPYAWAWNGSEWDQMPAPRPPTYLGPGVYDTEQDVQTFIAGTGPGGVPYAASWEFTPPGLPGIAEQPRDIDRCEGAVAEFGVEAVGTSLPEYRWTLNGADLSDGPTAWGSVLSGVGTRRLTITNAGPNDAGFYTCVLSNPCGRTISRGARLRICAGDFDCSGSVDFFDYLDFVAAFAASDPRADIDRNGQVDFFDYLRFLEAMRAGC